jgi:UDP:flavonoid glycosyltransferase YjiC (YdhE family)
VRILFTFAGGNGHLQPLLPLAHASREAGHEAAIAGQPVMAKTVEDAGHRFFSTGGDTFGARERMPLLELDAERERRDIREGFVRRTGRERAALIRSVCTEWRPDLVVCEEVDFGGLVAAESLGLPHATVLVTAAGSLIRKELLIEPLDELRARYGLPADPEVAMLGRFLVLSPFPPSFRDPAFPLPGNTHSLRPHLATAPKGEAVPAWLTELGDRPTVYFTLGTVFNTESGDLFPRALAGLRELPVNLVVTTGPHIDPAEFGPQPANVHMEQYVTQSLILPHCDAVVSHGGSGSVMGALAHGLPMTLLPMGADQPENADRCAALGVGRGLDVLRSTSEDIRDAVSGVLEDPSYRRAAEAIREEMLTLPGSESAVPLFEALVN